MDLVHFHVAVEPKNPAERSGHIPKPLCAMIMRLLEKEAEERYQTAHGVVADVDELLGRWTAGIKLDDSPFNLCQTDHPIRLIFPTHLIARSKELKTIRETCEAAVRKGEGLRVVMLKGVNGVGKSKLLMEVKRMACVERALFASAKFDQDRQGNPFGAYITILGSLISVSPWSFLTDY